MRTFLFLIFGTLLLTGCEGPSTTVLHSSSGEEEHTPAQLSSLVPPSSTGRLSESVDIFYTGSGKSDDADASLYDASTDPSVYITSSLRSLSYDVVQSGEIIEAVLPAEEDDCDVCLFIACYGGSDADTRASDTAAGPAVLLEVAEDLSGIFGDTEVHFVFLPGERSDTAHIYTYLTEVYTPDTERLLGAVVLGSLGLNEAAGNELGCAGGNATFMAEQINRICAADLGSECICTDSSEGVQNVLLRNSIPTVVYRQKETADAGTVLDCPALIDYEYLSGSADILSRTLALLIGDDTPSMQARAHFTDVPLLPYEGIPAWNDDLFMLFGRSEQEFEAATGLLGELISRNTINNGDELSGYRFSLRWFGSDDLLQTDLYYLSDSLQSIEIRAAEDGLEYETVYDEITSCYGESIRTSESPYGTACEWELPMQRVSITLDPRKEGYSLSLQEYDTFPSVYPSDSLGYSRLNDLFKKVIPESHQADISFETYTDGRGGTTGTLSGVSSASSRAGWTLGLDLDDALNKNADFRDKLQTIGELARLYGEYLAGTDAAIYYDDYNSRFGGGVDDFASSFRLFAMAREPVDEAGPAADPVRYFYDFDELVSFRDAVREIR